MCAYMVIYFSFFLLLLNLNIILQGKNLLFNENKHMVNIFKMRWILPIEGEEVRLVKFKIFVRT